jgi:hypothetical protein
MCFPLRKQFIYEKYSLYLYISPIKISTIATIFGDCYTLQMILNDSHYSQSFTNNTNSLKVKVNFSLCLIKHHVIKIYGDRRHSFTLRLLYPRDRACGIHWTGGRVGSTAGLDAVTKRKFPTPPRNRNPVVQYRFIK